MHLFRDCPRFIAARRDIFLDRLPSPDRTWSVRDLLRFSYLPKIDEAFLGTLEAYPRRDLESRTDQETASDTDSAG